MYAQPGFCGHPAESADDDSREPNPRRVLSMCSGVSETLVPLLQAQCTRTPGAIALEYDRESLTYRELDDRASRLARHLKILGVGPGTLVGLFIGRSVELVVAMLATLKARGAYVPVDPNYPAERVALVIEDCRAQVVLTTRRDRGRWPIADRQVGLVDVQTESAGAVQEAGESVNCPATGADLAYVIYTSGSTGKPKGVMVEHRNVLSFFSAMDRVLGTEPGVWLAVTSISFDISVLELLWTLARGFRVVLHGGVSTDEIAREMADRGVTHFQTTPSMAWMLAADHRCLAALGPLKKLLVGGEALPSALAAVLRRATSAEIFNMYGPTETTVWSTAYRVPDTDVPRAVVPIGWPLANTRAYLLDSEGVPVPDGEPGELYVAGEGVVRGYWERPELTAERFLPDPFAGEGRMYRTGDMARHAPGGELEFLGRNDFQVKLRGHRIELGEIEAVLERQPGVRQAVVVGREDRPGDCRLVAYVVPVDPTSASAGTLRAALAATLPEYMVPSHFVSLDRLPLTPNGKIDRTVLPAPTMPGRSSPPAPGAVGEDGPRSDLERLIEEVWAEALGVERVDRHQNVFDLGATSLMMPGVQVELRRRLARDIALVDLFEHHTISALAAWLEGIPIESRISDRSQRRRAARQRESTR
jgi:amino acid adenylation domain-containing protein